MKEVKISVNPQSFPNQFASDEEKKTVEYGLMVGQTIQYEWFKNDGSSSRFYNQKKEFARLRLYARGEQSVSKYKNELSVDGDLSYLNLDWTPVPILPKFVDIVVNGMSDRLFKVKVYSQDAMSQEKRGSFQDNIEGQMIAKPVLEQIQKDSGVDPFTMDPDELPTTVSISETGWNGNVLDAISSTLLVDMLDVVGCPRCPKITSLLKSTGSFFPL